MVSLDAFAAAIGATVAEPAIVPTTASANETAAAPASALAHASQIVISAITASSNDVTEGAVFVAIPGLQVHGASYAGQAIERGAVAIITDAEGAGLIAEVGVPVLVVDRVDARLGDIAAMFFDQPAHGLRSFGVTGTNGKTTTTYMLEQVLTAAGHLTALIGGVELRVGGVHTPTSITTPLPIDIQRMLRAHVDAGGSDAVMEVTSHALMQHRTDPIRFAVAGFTQLSIDHLDYHASIDEYFEAKAELFRPERCDAAVIVTDDEWGKKLYEIATGRMARVFALGVEDELPAGAAGWRVREVAADGSFELQSTEGWAASFTCGLAGVYNIANAALAITMAITGGVELAAIPRSIHPEVPGRMQVISETEPRVIVDFAHNADSLAKALIAVRPATKGRLIVVTGTAGDRDATKRFAMGEACAVNADVVVITDDDPHTEDPQQIRDALIAGTVGHDAEVIEIADRSEAIYEAVRIANDTDTVVIAGRGHWTVQFVGHDLVELDDREVAREALVARSGQ
ncbi:MAG: UDP-N-acetylmuramoyl-L-alanyl-D-glutamate--2,6-diaminopimelate ligase [Leucobacter sp.]|nr:UDP-N-acetylmuramoyl-L-alanyl-D-glutamate--2,6-diaminopimelate ligase [Leucobacter sp.]